MLISLKLEQPTNLYKDTENLTTGVEFWNRILTNDQTLERNRKDEPSSALQTPDRTPEFPRFDLSHALKNMRDIRTDFEAGCTQDQNNTLGAEEADQCKDEVAAESTEELRTLIKKVYQDEFGLELPKIRKGDVADLDIDHARMPRFSWYDGVLPWWSGADRYRKDSLDRSPFLDHVLHDDRCEQEFASGEFSTGKKPCYRNVQGEAHTVLPFYAERYAWPKAQSNTVLNSGFGLSCDDAESCQRYVNTRLGLFSKYMIGTYVCLKRDDVNAGAHLFSEHGCFASFCTDVSPVGTNDDEKCTNKTSQEFEDANCDEDKLGTEECPCEMVNSLHENKTLCQFSKIVNKAIEGEFPSKVEMAQTRQLFLDGKYHRWKPSFGRCAARFASVHEQYNVNGTGTRMQCRHKQAPLGYTNGEARAFLAGKFSQTLARTEVIPPQALKKDGFAMSRLRRRQDASLWRRDGIQRVLGDAMAYPVASGEQRYALLALDRSELGPVKIALRAEKIIPSVEPFRVQTVHLTAGSGDEVNGDWLVNVPAMFVYEQARLDASALHNATATASVGWACPFVLAGVLSGSHKLFDQHKNIRLLTPGPTKMRHLYPTLQGLHPLAKLREVNRTSEIHAYSHLGYLTVITNNESDVDLRHEVRLHFDQTQRCRQVNATDLPFQELELGVPKAGYTLRSGEELTRLLSTPAELLQLLPNATVGIFHVPSLAPTPAAYAMFAMHHPYASPLSPLNASARVRTTLDRGGECHKSRLTRIPRATLRKMLAYDTCALTWEDEFGTRRNITCSNANNTTPTTFALRTADIRTVDARAWHRYQSCQVKRAQSTPKYKAYTRLDPDGIALPRPELSLSRRQRISPLWRRLSDLKHSNLSFVFDTINTTAALRKLWDQAAVDRGVVSMGGAAGSGDPFDAPWMYECPPNSGNVTGKADQEVWLGSLRREDLCGGEGDVGAAACDLEKTLDLCKLVGLEDLCVAIRRFEDRIRRANMQRAGLIETSVALYTPSSFFQQEGRYAWEIVAGAYDQMTLVKAYAGGACRNVVSSQNIVEYDTIGEAGSSNTLCPSNYLMALTGLLERVRAVVIKLINLAIHLVDAASNFVMGLASALAPVPGGGGGYLVMYMQRMLRHLVRAWEILVDFMEELIDIFMIWFYQQSQIKAIVDLMVAACEMFKIVVQAIVQAVEGLLKGIQAVGQAFGAGGDFMNGAVETLASAREDVAGWNCHIHFSDECPVDACDQMYQPKLADTCYADVVADVGPLGGDLPQIGDSSTSELWIGKARGAYTCNSASYCRQGYGDVVFCEDCPRSTDTQVMSEYHCGADNRCQCGPQLNRYDGCFSNDDCGADKACQLLSDGFAEASGSTSCAPRPDFRALCLKAQPEDARGTCAQVLHYDTATLGDARCDPGDQTLGIPVVSGYCLFSPEPLQGAAVDALEFGALFVARCASAVSRLVSCLPVAFASGLLGETQPALRVYEVAYGGPGGARRRLLAAGGAREPVDAYVVQGRERAHPHHTLRAFVGSLLPRRAALTGPCRGAFDRDLNDAAHAHAALGCARWLLVVNATLEGTGVRDVDAASGAALWLAVREDPDVLSQMAQNAPRAAAAFAADAADVPTLLGLSGPALGGLRGMWRLLTAGPRGAAAGDPAIQALLAAGDVERGAAGLMRGLGRMPPSETNAQRAPDVAEPWGPDSRPPATEPENPPLAVQRRRLLQLETSTVATVTAYADQVELARLGEDRARTAALGTTTAGTLRGPGERGSPACSINTGSRVVGFLTAQLRISLRRHGWRELPECSSEDLEAWAAFFEGSCPVAEVVVGTVSRNVITLIEYYTALNNTGCLTDPDASCLQQPLYSRDTPAAAFPLIHSEPSAARPAAGAGGDDREPVVAWFVRGLKELLALFSFGTDTQQEVIWGFFSLKAAYEDDAYEAQVAANEFSVGRVLREVLKCDLEESLTCPRVRSPLLPSFFAVFLFLWLFTTFLPVPGVVAFFLWVIGLTTGVTYLAYGFSPLCWPAVPVCFGEGLYEVVQVVFPERVDFPPDGQVHGACERLAVRDTFSTVIAIESTFRQGRAVWTEEALRACDDFAEIAACRDALPVVDTIAGEIAANPGGAGLYYCIFFNLFRLGVVLCIIVLVAPVGMYAVAVVVPVALQGVRLALSSVSSVVGMYTEDAAGDDARE
jgi:hypothetical protein